MIARGVNDDMDCASRNDEDVGVDKMSLDVEIGLIREISVTGLGE